ncbi:hypothetical protein HY992_04760 [Candidatus Micrarchaeota archaeon]|nr:hypothetical protein [Candidatus Micrarchaeota archaeon]
MAIFEGGNAVATTRGAAAVAREPIVSRRVLEPMAEKVGAGDATGRQLNCARVPYRLARDATKAAVEEVERRIEKNRVESRIARKEDSVVAYETESALELRDAVLKCHEKIEERLQAELAVRKKAAALVEKALRAFDRGRKNVADNLLERTNRILNTLDGMDEGRQAKAQ